MHKSSLAILILVGLFSLVSCSAFIEPSDGMSVTKPAITQGATVTRGYLDFTVTSGQSESMAELLMAHDLYDGVKDNAVFIRADVLQSNGESIIRVPFATIMSVAQLEASLGDAFPAYQFEMTLVESYHGSTDWAPTNGRSEPKWNINSEQSEVNDWG